MIFLTFTCKAKPIYPSQFDLLISQILDFNKIWKMDGEFNRKVNPEFWKFSWNFTIFLWFFVIFGKILQFYIFIKSEIWKHKTAER